MSETSDTETSDSDRYDHLDIHVCESCKHVFQSGDDVVSLSDGYVNENNDYVVNNRRFYHRVCWRNSEYMDTGTEQNTTD